MHRLEQSYRGLSLLILINWDRVFFLGAITAALMISAYFHGH